ncbi:MAG: GNAT family N-acetyltransferase [Ruminococcaceae bacterium]|nr:GNAT family N-acetyltransferase [Oscillospiraceae bacterium]
MELIRLETEKSPIFEKVFEWSYNWWGKYCKGGEAETRSTLVHSLNTTRLPQTFAALDNGKPVGMYQLSMSDDLAGRPDIYPWLINVYVDEACRGKNICRFMMETVKENAAKAGLTELYLYTHHVGLYEKFGWRFIEYVDTFKGGEKERLYKMDIR